MLITSILNAVLDPIFIKLIGLHRAAAATVLSQIVSLILLIIYFNKKRYFKIRPKSFGTSYLMSAEKLSIPTVIQQYTPSLSSAVLISCVSNFRIAAMAGYGIVNKLDMILFMPATVLNMVLTPIIGYCIGGERNDRASDYVKISVKFSLITVAFCGVLLMIFAKPIAGIFGCSYETAMPIQHCICYVALQPAGVN